MKRRNMLYASAGAVAACAGAGAAWWTSRSAGADALSAVDAGRPTASDLASAQAAELFWRMRFDTPDGSALAMERFHGKRLLVNFWATWCPPCVEELPLLDEFYRQNKAANWQLVALAVDRPAVVGNWLKARPLGFPVGVTGPGGIQLSKSLGNVAGGLPFSVLFGASGEMLQRRVGQLSAQTLAAWAQLE